MEAAFADERKPAEHFEHVRHAVLVGIPELEQLAGIALAWQFEQRLRAVK